MLSMIVKDVTCDLFVGTGAGESLLDDIDSAKNSVQVVSPYLSSGFVGKLIDLHKRGITVSLYAMEDSKDALKPHLSELIKKPKKRISKLSKIMYGCSWLLSVLLILGSMILLLHQNGGFFTQVEFFNDIAWLPGELLLLGLIPLALFMIRYKLLLRKSKKHPDYQYSQLFPFTVFKPKGRALVHSKIYIVDSEVAYLGSLNFSQNGMDKSFETHIRTESQELIMELENTIGKLTSTWPKADIQELGSLI